MIRRLILRWLFTYKYEIVLQDEAKAPYKTYKNDAGYDLYVYKTTNIPKKSIVNIPTGVHIKSKGAPAWIYLTGRSSTLLRHGLIVDDGVIDDGYTGEMCVKVFNPTNKDVTLYPDMRIGQIIIIPHTIGKFVHVKNLKVKPHERGTRGFGSTGE